MKNNEIFKGIYGYSEEKESIKRIVDMLNNPKKYEDLGCDMLKGLLLYGPPGTGKTSLSLAILNAVNRPNFIIRKESTSDKLNEVLKTTFDKAIKSAPSIILLDDLDKFDSTEYSEDNSYIVQSLIDSVKDKDVYIIATVNDITKLPSSLTRKGRFDVKIEITNPAEKDSDQIIKHYLSSKKLSKDVNFDRVCNLLAGYSCADIESVCKKAGILAGYKNQNEILMGDIINSALELLYGGEENEIDNDKNENLKEVAYHEAGHVLVGEILNPGSVRFASVTRNFVKQGVAAYHKEIKGDDDQNQRNALTRVLAGKAATEVVFNRCDVGANSDLGKAFRIARKFVDSYCSEGFDSWFDSRDETSERVKANKDEQSSRMVKEHYNKAKEILISNRDKLDKIASSLIENKILFEDEIKTLMDSYKVKEYGNS